VARLPAGVAARLVALGALNRHVADLATPGRGKKSREKTNTSNTIIRFKVRISKSIHHASPSFVGEVAEVPARGMKKEKSVAILKLSIILLLFYRLFLYCYATSGTRISRINLNMIKILSIFIIFKTAG